MPTLVVLVLRFRKPSSETVSPILPPVEAVLVPLVLPFSFPVPEPLPSPAAPGPPVVNPRTVAKDGGDAPATPDIPATPPVVIGSLQTGGGGGGFGITLSGGVGNVTNVDLGYTQAYGTAQTSGFGSGQGQSLFGQAGSNGGGTSTGNGEGALKPVVGAGDSTMGEFLTTPLLTTTLFNGTGGGLASGAAGGYVGFNPNTPVLFDNFPLGL